MYSILCFISIGQRETLIKQILLQLSLSNIPLKWSLTNRVCYDGLMKAIANYRTLYLIAKDGSGSYLFQKIQSCVVSRTPTVINNIVVLIVRKGLS